MAERLRLGADNEFFVIETDDGVPLTPYESAARLTACERHLLEAVRPMPGL